MARPCPRSSLHVRRGGRGSIHVLQCCFAFFHCTSSPCPPSPAFPTLTTWMGWRSVLSTVSCKWQEFSMPVVQLTRLNALLRISKLSVAYSRGSYLKSLGSSLFWPLPPKIPSTKRLHSLLRRIRIQSSSRRCLHEDARAAAQETQAPSTQLSNARSAQSSCNTVARTQPSQATSKRTAPDSDEEEESDASAPPKPSKKLKVGGNQVQALVSSLVLSHLAFTDRCKACRQGYHALGHGPLQQ